MSERNRGMAIAMLAEAFGVKLENLKPARIRIYDQALQKVPTNVLPLMTERVIATRRPRWGDLPPVSELLEDAETVRLEMLKTLGDYGCDLCASQKGWRTVTRSLGDLSLTATLTVERCDCWHRFQQRRAELGVGSESLALPEAREVEA